MPSCESVRPASVSVEGPSKLAKREITSTSTSTSDPETEQKEQIKNDRSVIDDTKDTADHSDSGSTDDDERAAKWLNPGAKEFLPVSPDRDRAGPQPMMQPFMMNVQNMPGMPGPVWYGPPGYGYPGYVGAPFSPDKPPLSEPPVMVAPDGMPFMPGYGMPPMPWMGAMPFHGPVPQNMGQDGVRMGVEQEVTERPTEDVSRQDDGPFKLDVEKVKGQIDARTTIMVKNIPNKYTQRNLLELIDTHHEGTYDFFYLPIDFKNKCNLGYAFINFTHPMHIVPFFLEFANKRWGRFNSDKVCELSYARIQSKGALVAHFRNSRLMFKHEKYRPLVFGHDGAGTTKPAPFPAGPSGHARRNRGGGNVPNGVPLVLVNAGIPMGMQNGMLANSPAAVHAMAASAAACIPPSAAPAVPSANAARTTTGNGALHGHVAANGNGASSELQSPPAVATRA